MLPSVPSVLLWGQVWGRVSYPIQVVSATFISHHSYQIVDTQFVQSGEYRGWSDRCISIIISSIWLRSWRKYWCYCVWSRFKWRLKSWAAGSSKQILGRHSASKQTDVNSVFKSFKGWKLPHKFSEKLIRMDVVLDWTGFQWVQATELAHCLITPAQYLLLSTLLF